MKMVFTAGKTIVKQCLDTREMEFIRLSDQIETIEHIGIRIQDCNRVAAGPNHHRWFHQARSEKERRSSSWVHDDRCCCDTCQ